MKTARLYLSFIFLFSICSYGAVFLNYEEDLRAIYISDENITAEINSIGGSIRKILPGKKGDRLILYIQAEAEHNFSSLMLHQLFIKFKGPMGKWNITAGRVQLPWGLLTSWSPERMPYTSPYKHSDVFKADNGILLDGTIRIIDYGIAITQGFGMKNIEYLPGPGAITGRIGVSPLISGDLIMGISCAYRSFNKSYIIGDKENEIDESFLLAFDLTSYIRRAIIRLEGGGKLSLKHWEIHGFFDIEYQLLPKLALHGSGNIFTAESKWNGTIFWGLSTKLKALTIRGGYEYEKIQDNKHSVVLQLHRLLSYNR